MFIERFWKRSFVIEFPSSSSIQAVSEIRHFTIFYYFISRRRRILFGLKLINPWKSPVRKRSRSYGYTVGWMIHWINWSIWNLKRKLTAASWPYIWPRRFHSQGASVSYAVSSMKDLRLSSLERDGPQRRSTHFNGVDWSRHGVLMRSCSLLQWFMSQHFGFIRKWILQLRVRKRWWMSLKGWKFKTSLLRDISDVHRGMQSHRAFY